MWFEFSEDVLELLYLVCVFWDVLGKMELGVFSKGCGVVEGRAG